MSTRAAVSLAWLLDGIAAPPANDAAVCDLTLDSRAVRAGSLFLAVPGRTAHGLAFAGEAAARGAAAVLWDPEGVADGLRSRGGRSAVMNTAVVVAPVSGLRRLVGRIADRFFGSPSSQLRVTGVTGTNGKTTCAYLLAQCLARLRGDAAYMGTLGWGRVAALEPPTHTTPDAVSVHRQLAALLGLGVREVAMEVSSHALDQGRVDGVRFQCAAFTNLTRDHLDYHGTMEAYGAAKARLFAWEGLLSRVVNVGDAFGRDLAAAAAGGAPLTAVWVGTAQAYDPGAAGRMLYADGLEPDPHGIALELHGSFGSRRLQTRLIGRFNAENAVLVAAVLTALGVPLDAAAAALAGCSAPPGRMELIESPAPGRALAVIDYAHTPDALAKALDAVREHCRGTVWCVFGCGGDRDPGKRPEMGAVADRHADRIIVTDDNPRSENPQAITRAIAQGITAHPVRIINDRGEAIATALGEARGGDIVLIAGKGHEDYQIYGDVRRRFSDRLEAGRLLGVAA